MSFVFTERSVTCDSKPDCVAAQLAMLKWRIRSFLLKFLGKSLGLAAKPFSTAGSIPTYARWGFIYLGVILLCVTALVWTTGQLNYPLSRSHPLLQGIYKFTVEKTPFKFVPDSYLSLFAIPFVLYLALAFWPSKRAWAGEKFANLIFATLNRLIMFGEWCIEHRWATLLFIMIMVVVLSLGVNQLIGDASRERALQQDFEHWLKETQDLVERSAFTKQETERYQHARRDWNESFKRLTHHPGGYISPAEYLNKMLDTLYQGSSELPWKDFLLVKLPELTELVEKSRSDLRQELNPSERKAWELINILMGRTYVRVASETSDYAYLSKALKCFAEVKLSDYLPAANNGRGTIYANAFSAFLPTKAGSLVSPEQLQPLKSVCTDSYQCAAQSLRAYEAAGTNSTKCSFQDKRRMNNSIDLLMRIGMRYDDVTQGRINPPIETLVESRSGLADEIERRIADLMNCNHQEPLIPTAFVTVAQAYGASAKLRLESGQDATSERIAAGTYLRLANSLEPQNVSNWELSYFCFAIKEGVVDTLFKESFEKPLTGMAKGDRLINKIQHGCR